MGYLAAGPDQAEGHHRPLGAVLPGDGRSGCTPSGATCQLIEGDVAAGTGVLAEEDRSRRASADSAGGLHRLKKDLFMLKVHGDSMVNAGILDGDYVVVSTQAEAEAESGDIVVAGIGEDEATVKTFRKRPGGGSSSSRRTRTSPRWS